MGGGALCMCEAAEWQILGLLASAIHIYEPCRIFDIYILLI
jgi:hypothetical protein